MKLVYSHDNPALVGLAHSLLEEAGLEVTLKNEFSVAGFPPYNLRQEVWLLDDKDIDKAAEILEQLSGQDPGEA